MAHLLSYTLYINMQASKLKNFKEAKFKLDQAALLERLKAIESGMKMPAIKEEGITQKTAPKEPKNLAEQATDVSVVDL